MGEGRGVEVGCRWGRGGVWRWDVDGGGVGRDGKHFISGKCP